MTKQTLEQFLLQNYSRQTVSSYLFAINHFLKLNPKAKRYKYVNIVEYMDEISKKNSNSKYRVVILSAIKKYYDYLVMSGYRNDHPCKRLNIKVNSNQAIQVQDLFSSSELQLLLERENRYKHLDVRNNVLLSLLIYQGLTSDEIIRLNVKDVDLDNGTIYIKASINLNKRTMNLVPRQMILFFNYLQETRLEILRCKTEKLIITKLGKPITVGGIHGMIDPLRVLFPDRKLNPQTIRMSVICNWLNEKNIALERTQELAGHKWPGTTEKYIKVNSSQQREMINRYFPNI
ncbi:site-specific recombinase XerD [Flavobacterium sp. HSC-32F16]|uniref:tyrosine-type recombinase/integrase n=1 Tax=Flavobacterium sp. HSC-32F16 TaxID=2910964 RepID=UPI0020A46143|nr:site-specific integrase [Flavobacterium sp. HSC-32F16]MCP2025399.1 site-specific recombinase XerD [Flavobacterium sp. HSC-32F16]